MRFLTYLTYLGLALLASCGSASSTADSTATAAGATDTVSSGPARATLLFVGDAMQHQDQIDRARELGGGNSYNYDECFTLISPTVKEADYAVVNLEVPLGGGKGGYTGFPCSHKLKRLTNINRYTQVPCESVAGTGRDDAHRHACAGHGARHFVDSTVAADSHYNRIVPAPGRLRGKLGGMTRGFGVDHAGSITEYRTDKRGNTLLGVGTRLGIDYYKRRFHTIGQWAAVTLTFSASNTRRAAVSNVFHHPIWEAGIFSGIHDGTTL